MTQPLRLQKIPVQAAVGKPLFHDMTAILENGYKGARFKRGHVVTPADVPVLLDMGKAHVYVWEETPGWVHEEDAARLVVEAAAGEGVEIPAPSEGRFPLRAAQDGVFVLNRAGLEAINAVPDYTFATLRHGTPVRAGDVVVGARIVPLLTGEERVRQAEAAARRYAPVFRVMPYRPLKTGMVITGSEIYEGRIQDAFQPILETKIRSFGGEALGPVICPDDAGRIEAAVRQLAGQGAQLVLMTGGMSVDPDDLTPTVIRRLSDRFLFQGIPVQPGNMLTVGCMGDVVLMGVPGASMHSPVTSVDLFLPLIYAGVPFDARDAARMGEGGLSVCQLFPRQNNR